MSELFKKAACFTDIHFGRSSNNPIANQDNLDFIDWFIAEAKKENAETCIFLGDWHDNRHQVQALTMDYSLRGMEKINNAFDKVFFIPGNHDLFYRDRRDVASIAFSKKFSNIELIMEPQVIDGVGFAPWIIGDEHKHVAKMDCRYMFAHLEVPGFLMNAKVEMPDSGLLKDNDFKKQEYVFTGHFHMRQAKNNIFYIGNVMPFNFSDAWDEDRGMMLLEFGKEPEFRTWQNQPLYRTMNLSELLDSPDKFLVEKLTARVSIDIDISYEEAQLIKETFIDDYKMRKIELVNKSKPEADQQFGDDVVYQSVDQIVIDGLNSITSSGLDPKLLVDIYKNLSTT